MASVMVFWWFPEEEQEFLQYLNKSGLLVAVTDKIVTDPTEIVVSGFDTILASGADRILFTRDSFAASLRIESGMDRGRPCYGVSARQSPFISYSRGAIIPTKKLRQSKLYAEATFLDDHGEVVQKPMEFVKWYKRVFGWASQRTPLWHQYKSYRITERVASAIQEGWELVQ